MQIKIKVYIQAYNIQTAETQTKINHLKANMKDNTKRNWFPIRK